MKIRMLLSLIVVLSIVWMAGCGHYTCGVTFGGSCAASGTGIGGTTGSNGNLTAFVYSVDDAGVGMAVEGLNVANSGTYEALSSFVAPTLPTGPLSDGGILVVNKKFMYIPFLNDTVYGFSIDSTTSDLTPVTNSPYTVLGSISEVADPTGRFLFVGDSADAVHAYTINSDGSLTEATGSPVSTGGVYPAQMATDGLGRYLYAASGVGGSSIAAFTYDQGTGALTTVSGSPFVTTGTVNFGMGQVAGESSGIYLLGTTQQAGEFVSSVDDHLYVFGITQSGTTAGAIAPVTGSPFATTYPPQNIAVSPNGAFVYTFNQDNLGNIDPMEGFQLSSISSGILTPINGSPFTGLNAEIGRFDQSGQYIFAVALEPNTNNVATYPYTANTSTGALTSTFPFLGVPSLSYVATDEP